MKIQVITIDGMSDALAETHNKTALVLGITATVCQTKLYACLVVIQYV